MFVGPSTRCSAVAASTDYSSKPLSIRVDDLCLFFFFQFVAWTTR